MFIIFTLDGRERAYTKDVETACDLWFRLFESGLDVHLIRMEE